MGRDRDDGSPARYVDAMCRRSTYNLTWDEIGMRLALIAILLIFSLGLSARAQSFSRQDLDCAVAAKIEDERAGQGTTEKNSFHELIIFFIRRLNAQDDQTNWAKIVYDRSKLDPKRNSTELLGKCTELYQLSLRR